MIRVVLPYHLRNLARLTGEVELAVDGPVTQRTILDALEARYPMLRGTIRDHTTHLRRAFVRFYACDQDFSNDSPDALLPDEVACGEEPFLVVECNVPDGQCLVVGHGEYLPIAPNATDKDKAKNRRVEIVVHKN